MATAASERDTVRRHSYHALTVWDVVHETHDTRTYVMDIPDSLAELYRYRPGQFCAVRIHVDGADVLRCYSMSSAPAIDAQLAVTVKRVPGGVVSNWLHDHVAAGDVLELMPPSGVFCEREGDGPVIAFCGGSGVTPVFSIVKQVLAAGTRRVELFYANRDPSSVIFGDALAELETAHPGRLAVQHHLDNESGFVTRADVAAFLDRSVGDAAGDAHVYLCGPAPFMDLVEQGALDAGIAPDHVVIERFANASAIGSIDLQPIAVEATPVTVEPPAASTVVATTLTITIKGRRHVLEHVQGDTVLDSARRASLKPPSSCEQGNCATCMALVSDGTVTMRVNNALTPEEVAEGWILTCQALPTSPTLALEYDDL